MLPLNPASVIVVKLDGVLIRSDLFWERIFLFLNRHPMRFFTLLLWIFHGRSYLQDQLSRALTLDIVHLPYHQRLLQWLKQQRLQGASLTLLTANDIQTAQQIADHLGIFDEVLGAHDLALTPERMHLMLVERYGEHQYRYIGNAKSDLPIWQSAAIADIANPRFGVHHSLNQLCVDDKVQFGATFIDRPSYPTALRKALRVQQWVKNILIFIPLIAAHRIFDKQMIIIGIICFFCFSICASSVYLLNDLLDIPDDRLHPSKRKRPLAAGYFPIQHAVVLIPVLLLTAFTAALCLLPIKFSIYLLGYYALTLAYSSWLKRIVMIDVVVLALLYSTRVVAGGAAMDIGTTFWILTFCLFIFLSLAFVKRHAELFHLAQRSGGETEQPSGRGYYASDHVIIATLGSASGYIAVLVLALYINEPTTGLLYKSQKWLWLTCPLLLFWISRVWFLAHRGLMNDDPLVFALRDKISRVLLVIFVIVFYGATIR